MDIFIKITKISQMVTSEKYLENLENFRFFFEKSENLLN